MNFDPDSFLADSSQSAEKSPSSGFDPDAFIADKPQESDDFNPDSFLAEPAPESPLDQEKAKLRQEHEEGLGGFAKGVVGNLIDPSKTLPMVGETVKSLAYDLPKAAIETAAHTVTGQGGLSDIEAAGKTGATNFVRGIQKIPQFLAVRGSGPLSEQDLEKYAQANLNEQQIREQIKSQAAHPENVEPLSQLADPYNAALFGGGLAENLGKHFIEGAAKTGVGEALAAGRLAGTPEVAGRLAKGAAEVSNTPVSRSGKVVAKVADMVGGGAERLAGGARKVQDVAKGAAEAVLPGMGEDAQKLASQAASMAGVGYLTGNPILGVFSGALPSIFSQIANTSKAAARVIMRGEGSVPFFRQLATDPSVTGLSRLSAQFLDASGLGRAFEGIGRSLAIPIDHPGMPAAFAAYGTLSSGGDVDQASANIFNAYAIPMMGAAAAEPGRANRAQVIAGKQITDVANYFKTLTPEQQAHWSERFKNHPEGADHVADELIAVAQLRTLRPGVDVQYAEGEVPHIDPISGQVVLPINPVDSKGRPTDYLARILAHEIVHNDLGQVSGEEGTANRAGILSTLVGNPATKQNGTLISYGPDGSPIMSPALQKFSSDYLTTLTRSLERAGTAPERITAIIDGYKSDPIKLSEEWLAEQIGSIWTSHTNKGELAYTRMARGGKLDQYRLKRALEDPTTGVTAALARVYGVSPDDLRDPRFGDNKDLPKNILNLAREIQGRGAPGEGQKFSFEGNDVVFSQDDIVKNPQVAASHFDASNNIEWKTDANGNVVGVDRILTKRQAEKKQQVQAALIKTWIDQNKASSPDEVQKVTNVDAAGRTITTYRGKIIPAGLKQAILQSKLWNPLQLIAFEKLQDAIKNGTPVEVLYQAALKNGKYAALEAAPRTIIPFEFVISQPEGGVKGSNILVTTLNLTRLKDNYQAAVERNQKAKTPVEMPSSFDEAINQVYGVFENYRRGYHGTGEVPKGAASPSVPPAMVLSEHQRNFVNELMGINMASNEGRNPYRTLLESENLKSSKSAINSFRLDRINNLTPTEMPNIQVDYGKSKINFSPTEEPKKSEINVALSANTPTIEGIRRLNEAAAHGDVQAHEMLINLAKTSVEHLTSQIPSLEAEFTAATGLYGGAYEPSLGIKLSFDEADRPATLAALAQFAENFNQEQVHVRGPIEPGSEPGTIHPDKGVTTPVYRWNLTEPLSREQAEKLISKSGLPGATVAKDYIEIYYADDPTNSTEQSKFIGKVRAVDNLLRGQNSGFKQTTNKLWVYGSGEHAIPFSEIRGDVHTGEAKENPIAGQIANRLAGREVTPSPQAKEMTPEQTGVHKQIATDYEKLRDNALDDPKVKKAYDDLDKELREQFSALPIKVEIYTGKGEPYGSSSAMRNDVLRRNHLFIFGTDKDNFGPAGVTYQDHPLLRDSGFQDIHGKPLLVNDLLRAVHDYYAHTLSPVQFGPLGEEAAWRNHMAMTKSPWARWALTSETRGQNSYVNYGPHGEANQANPKFTNYAPQKVDLLPIKDAKTGDPRLDAEMDAISLNGEQAPKTETPRFSPVQDALKGWMDTSGGLERIGEKMHNEYASEKTGIKNSVDAADHLFDKNYLRLRPDFGVLFVSNEKGLPPTTKQVRELKNLAIENDFRRVIYDGQNGSGRKTLWDKSQEETGAGDERYSGIEDMGFYSKVGDEVEKLPGKFTVGQLRGALAPEKGIKPEELEWMNFEATLAGKGPNEKLTKEEVQKWAKENEIKVNEVVKGRAGKSGSELFEEKIALEHKIDMLLLDVPKETKFDDLQKVAASIHPELPAMQQKYNELNTQIDAINREKNDTKFSQYQLPGGTNYRELLLTLPEPTDSAALPEGYTVVPAPQGNRFAVRDARGQTIGYGDTREQAVANAGVSQARMKKNDVFQSSHFDEPNVLAHVRFNERTDAAGNKVLFLEEVQSDWHQKGRKRGYASDIGNSPIPENIKIKPEEVKVADSDKNESTGIRYVVSKDGYEKGIFNTSNDAELFVRNNLMKIGSVPDAPFKKTWHELVMKRMLDWAVKNGFDKLAWTTGEQQAERYDLSKQVSEVVAVKNNDGTINIVATGHGGDLIHEKNLTLEKVSDVLGKDLADKIKDQTEPSKSYKGVDLKVGGEGMEGFYDKMLPAFMDKYGKKFGAKVEQTSFSTTKGTGLEAVPTDHGWSVIDGKGETVKDFLDENYNGDSSKAARDFAKHGSNKETVHSVAITPQLKEAIIGKGQALFSGVQENIKTVKPKLVGTDVKVPGESEFVFSPLIAKRFSPTSDKVDLNDFIGRKVFALTSDRLGIGSVATGPEGAKKEIETPAQGGRGFMNIFNGGGWAFSTPESANRFMTRVKQVAGEEKSALVGITILSEANHMNSPYGQLAYVNAIRAAVETGVVSERQADQHVRELAKRILVAHDATYTTDFKDKLAQVHSLADLEKLVKAKAFNFKEGSTLIEKAQAKTLPIPEKFAKEKGFDVASIARDIADPELVGAPAGSVVALMEVNVDQKPEKSDFHYSYPFTIHGTKIGFLKDFKHISELTSNKSIYQSPGVVGAQPLMTVMPELDKLRPDVSPRRKKTLDAVKLRRKTAAGRPVE
jgi:hypothetical protein